jgi:hypothetical protein
MKERTSRIARELLKDYKDIDEYSPIVNSSMPVHKRFIEQAFSLRGAAK